MEMGIVAFRLALVMISVWLGIQCTESQKQNHSNNHLNERYGFGLSTAFYTADIKEIIDSLTYLGSCPYHAKD